MGTTGTNVDDQFQYPQYPCFIRPRPLARETRSGADCRFVQAATRGLSGAASRSA